MSGLYRLRRGTDVYDRPKITGPDTAYLSWTTPDTRGGDWRTDGTSWITTQTGALTWLVPSLATHDVSARIDGPGSVEILFRWQDDANGFVARWDPALGSTAIWRVKAGVWFRVVESRRSFPQCPVLRVGLEGPVIVLYGPTGDRVASFTDDSFLTATRAGVRRTAAQSVPVQVRSLRVESRIPEGYIWPGQWSTPVLDVPLGAKGTWEDTDINNPNVVWDPSASQWTMNYTGYSETKGGGIQDAGLATAATLDGPWTKHPSNPVFVDDAAGRWSQNGGYIRRPDGTWLLAYSAVGGQQPWFATAPSPSGPWTKQPSWQKFYGSDPHLRVREDGKIECTFYRDSNGTGWPGWNIYMRTSTDGGQTWGEQVKLLDSMPVHWVQGGEPSVLVPPGGEDRVKLIAVDFMPDGQDAQSGRGTMLNVTRDNGATWARHILSRRSYAPGTFDEYAAFDSYLVYDQTRKRLYEYYGGAQKPDNQTLGIGIQIGHKWSPWDPEGM